MGSLRYSEDIKTPVPYIMDYVFAKQKKLNFVNPNNYDPYANVTEVDANKFQVGRSIRRVAYECMASERRIYSMLTRCRSFYK